MPEQGYCVKCRTKKIMKDDQRVITKNNRAMIKGKCPDCNTVMCRIMGKNKGESNG